MTTSESPPGLNVAKLRDLVQIILQNAGYLSIASRRKDGFVCVDYLASWTDLAKALRELEREVS